MDIQFSSLLCSNSELTLPAFVLPATKPLVTALICNYNYENYLAKAIDSALWQTWKRVEVLIVDDGSTDQSREIIKSYGDKVRVLLKENGGQASAFNVGVAAAQGEIICLLDSDDIWEPEKITSVVEKYQEGYFGLVCHDLRLIDMDGHPTGVNWTRFAGVVLEAGDVKKKVMQSGYPWVFSPTSGMSLPTVLAKKIFPLNEAEWRISADDPLAHKAICHAPVGVIDKSLGRYRVHGANGFAAFHSDDFAVRVAAIIDPAKRFFFLRSYLVTLGEEVDASPKDDYHWYRRACMIARGQPLKWILRLWFYNFKHLFKCIINGKSIDTFKFILVDPLLALAISLDLAPQHRVLRRLCKEEMDRLSPTLRDWILND